MEAVYDVFLSYAHRDQDAVRALVQALQAQALRVFLDENDVEAFSSIQKRVEEGIANSKALLAWYSHNYCKSRPCQWELSAAYVCGPGERVLVVNPEAGTEHIRPRSLLDWLFAPGTDLNSLAREVARRVAQITGAIGEDFRLRQPRSFGFQPAGSNRFVGRLPELWAIHDGLARSANPMLSGVARSVVQIRGIGGIGKSLLAEEYALRFGTAFPEGIFWLKAFGSDRNKTAEDREADRRQQITEFAAQVPLSIENKRFPEIWAMLTDELSKKRCLWIVDDAPSGLTREQLSEWYSPHPGIPTLITIPDFSHDDLGVKVDVPALAEEEALQLLGTHNLTDAERVGAVDLVKVLGGHPLGIEIAASYLEFRNGAVSCADFARQLRSSRGDQLELAAKLKHAPGIVSALSATLAQLSAPAIDLLVLASMLASAAIPAELIDVVFARVHQCSMDEAQIMRLEATSQTDQFALSRFDPVRPEARRIHALVSRTARLHATSPERAAQIGTAAVAALTEALEGVSYAKIFRLGLESTHARELSTHPANGEEAALLVLVGTFDLVRGDAESAERLGQRALEYCRTNLGDGLELSNRANGLLGQVLLYRGDYAGARAIFEPVVAFSERNRTPGNLYRLGAQVSLAMVLSAQAEFAEAQRIAEQAVAEAEAAHGAEHELTLQARSALAQILTVQGNSAKAVEQMQNVLAIRRRRAIEGDPDLLVEDLSLIKAQPPGTDLRPFEPVLDKAVTVFAAQFGEENTLTLQARLYRLYVLLGKGAATQAERDAAELIVTLDRVLGPAHPLTLQARAVQALILSVLGREAEAQAIIEPLPAQLEKAFSKHHPEVFATKAFLIHILMSSGFGQFDRVREIWDELMADPAARTHPAVFTSGNSIAMEFGRRNEHQAARSLLLAMLPEAEKCLGPEAPAVLIAKTGLALNASALGQFGEAAEWWEEVLAARLHLLGNEHPDTTSTAWSLFLMRWRLQQYAECYRIFEERFLWFCDKDASALNRTQRDIVSSLAQNTPWLARPPA